MDSVAPMHCPMPGFKDTHSILAMGAETADVELVSNFHLQPTQGSWDRYLRDTSLILVVLLNMPIETKFELKDAVEKLSLEPIVVAANEVMQHLSPLVNSGAS